MVITDDQKSGICDALKAKISSLEKDNIELREKVTQLMAQNKGILENFVTRFDVRIKGFIPQRYFAKTNVIPVTFQMT